MENLGSLFFGVPGKRGRIRHCSHLLLRKLSRPLSVTRRVNKSLWGTAKATPAIGRGSSDELIGIWNVVKVSSWNKEANIIIKYTYNMCNMISGLLSQGTENPT